MNEYHPLPSVEALKQQAKRLRAQISVDAREISHSKLLELLAHQFGYRDWNTLHSACANQNPGAPVTLGGTVSGRYLDQPFRGQVVALAALNNNDQYRVTIKFEKPVDVVKFHGWSAMRKRVTSSIGQCGQSRQKTSNGMPVMAIDL